MIIRPHTIFLFTTLSLGLLASAEASEWMRSGGESSLSTSLSFDTGNSYWDRNRHLRPGSCTANDRALGVLYEYGYSYYYTVFAETELRTRDCGNTHASGIPDATFGIRGRLNMFRNQRTWQLSATIPVQGDLYDPTKPGNGAFGLAGGLYFLFTPSPYDKEKAYRTDGVWGWSVGANLWSGGVGHLLWTEGVWRKSLKQTWAAPWSFSAGLRGEYGFGGDSATTSISAQPKSLDYDQITGKLALSRPLSDHSGVRIGYNHDLWGRNTGKNHGFSLSLYYSWGD